MSDLQNTAQTTRSAGIAFRNVILPIHTSGHSQTPFAHALKLVCNTAGDLEIVDVRSDEEATEHIGVRSMLERWGVLPPGSHRSDVAEVGVRVKKIVKEGNKRRGVVERLRKHSHDLLVIGTESHATHAVFGRDLAEYLAEYFHQTTLFIPSGARPFVDEQTGQVTLDTVLVPVGNSQLLRPALDALRRLLASFPEASPLVVGLHAGQSFPDIERDLTEGLRWSQETSDEPVGPAIVSTAIRHRADLIVMSTNGRDTLLQMVAGSNTEQVLRSAPCPVLSAPAS